METSFSDQLKLMQGRLRIVQEVDGVYVVGEGLRLPVKSYKEGLELIRECEAKLRGVSGKDNKEG